MVSERDLDWLSEMVNRHRLLLTFKTARWRHWQPTVMWVLYNFLGSLMPIWGAYFLLHLYSQSFVLNDFVKHGEFALLTAAFLAPALQQVAQSIRDERYVLGTGSVLVAVTGLVISAIIYSGVIIKAEPFTRVAGSAEPGVLDENYLFHISLWLFSLSLLFAVVVTLVQNVIFEAPLEALEKSTEARFERRFSEQKPQTAAGLAERPLQPIVNPADEPDELAKQFSASQGGDDQGETDER